MSTFRGVTHAPALCAADPTTNPGGVLRLQAAGYTCLVCQDVADTPAPREPEPCEGVPFASFADSMAAAIAAGFQQWRQFTCTEGHQHVTEGRF